MRIVILGNGIAGITAARHIRKKSDYNITVISAETEYFFSRTALMYVYMGHMKFKHTQPYEDHFWKKNRIDLVQDYVESIDFGSKKLNLSNSQPIDYDKLILAVGSKPNKFGWPGQDLPGVQGLYSYQDLQLLEESTHAPNTPKNQRTVKRAVIVGGGLIGVEMAEMLHTRDIEVTFLIREDRFWGNVLPKEDGELVCRHLKEHHIDLRLESELDEILPGVNGRVRAIKTKKGEEIECQLVGLTAGVSPNIDFLKESKLETQRGIVVNQYLETNIPDVFAIGDCAQSSEPASGRRPVEQVWYTGRMMGETVAKTICGTKTAYTPGFWFNSAKFFDIEYQTYGTVLSELSEGQEKFYWEDPTGKIGVKMVYEKQGGKFIGINTFGIRMRHEVFDRWLREGRGIDHVMQHLSDANFDTECYKLHEPAIVEAYNRQSGKKLKLKKRSWKRIFDLSA